MSDIDHRTDADVFATLHFAMVRRLRVTAIVRGDASSARASRLIEGRPIGFRPARDGRERVVLQVVEGEAQQLLLLERIARVSINDEG